MDSKTFTYKAKFSYSIFIAPIFLFLLGVYCYYFDSTITYRNKTIIASPYSYIISGILGILFLVYAMYELRAYKDAVQNKAGIKISENDLIFPYKKSSLNINFKNVTKLYIKDSSDEGESVIIYSKNPNDRHEFYHNHFESTEKYLDFKTHLEKSIHI